MSATWTVVRPNAGTRTDTGNGGVPSSKEYVVVATASASDGLARSKYSSNPASVVPSAKNDWRRDSATEKASKEKRLSAAAVAGVSVTLIVGFPTVTAGGSGKSTSRQRFDGLVSGTDQ